MAAIRASATGRSSSKTNSPPHHGAEKASEARSSGRVFEADAE
jgi:hypothetical protein